MGELRFNSMRFHLKRVLKLVSCFKVSDDNQEARDISNLTAIKKVLQKHRNHMCHSLNSLYWGWSSHL